MLGKMGKKSKKSKEYESSNLEELVDCTDAVHMGMGNNKITNEVGGGVELDGICKEAVNSKGCVEVDGDVQMEKNHRKKKRKLESSDKVTDCLDEANTGGENNFKLIKEDKRKKKKKKKHDVDGAIVLHGILDEAVNGKDSMEVNGGLQKEKYQNKEKKKKKLDSGEYKSNLNGTNYAGGGNGILQTNDRTSDSEFKSGKDQKKKREEKKKKSGSSTVSSSVEILENEIVGTKKVAKGIRSSDKEDTSELKNAEEGAKKKKNKKKGRKDSEDCDVSGNEQSQDGEEVGKSMGDYDQNAAETFESKKRKREKKNKTKDSEAKNGNIGKRKKAKEVEKGSENPKGKGKSKKVRFSGDVEIFPSDDTTTGKEKNQEEDLVRGKWFTREEDEILKQAVLNYIEAHGLGEEGLNMVMHCNSHPEIRTCWKEIGAALPHRPHGAIYYRAHILFERDEKRKWTKEEYDIIRKYQEKHGNDWKSLADELGKHRFHVKDTWRRIKLSNMKKGHWSQEEYQTLFDLVNTDLRMKTFEEKKSKHGMLRDNIAWGAISDRLSTRANATCCKKWYNQLTSPMVIEGTWADTDDYRLLDTLFYLDACCIEDVNWDDLLDHRSGDVCRKRWDQMVLHIGHHGNKSFAEQVEILAKRYCPDLLEARETWDSKPLVP